MQKGGKKKFDANNEVELRGNNLAVRYRARRPVDTTMFHPRLQPAGKAELFTHISRRSSDRLQ